MFPIGYLNTPSEWWNKRFSDDLRRATAYILTTILLIFSVANMWMLMIESCEAQYSDFQYQELNKKLVDIYPYLSVIYEKQ